jgi:anaerobic selenocysteine-containing dehydrogenase
MAEPTKVSYRTCPLCEATCGLEIETRGRTVVKVRGDPEDVFSRGYVCPKGTALGALHGDPDRLRRPLVRRGGRHVEVSFDEAFAEVERGLAPVLARHGRNAVAVYLGNPNAHTLEGSLYVRPLLKALATRNLYSASTADQMPKHVSSGLLFGDPGAIPVPDVDRTDFLLMLGANPLESNGSLCTAPDFPGRLKALRERGGKLVVVDPRRTRTAKIADEHHFIRPGTDALLLCALLHTVFDEGLEDPGRLAEYVEGLEDLRAAVRPFSPERVAPRCGIDAATIRRLGRELCAEERAAVYGRIGTHTVAFGTLASFAVDALNTVTGNLDREGGAMFPLPAHARRRGDSRRRGFRTGRWKSRVRGLPEVRGELPVATLADEMETGGEDRIRALVTVAGNPVLSAPEADRLDAALAGLDFMVSVDIYLNETTRHADVVLPVPSPLEKSHYDLALYGVAVRNVANYSPPVFEPEGPSEADVLARLALVVSGQGAGADPGIVHAMLLRGIVESQTKDPNSPIHGRDVEEIVSQVGDRRGPDALLEVMLRTGAYGDGFGASPGGLSLARLDAHPHGIDLGPLAPRVPEILSTESGRIELMPEAIRADLARLEAELDAPAPAGLLLVGRRHLRSNNSWMHNLAPLVRGRDRCTLQVSPSDARRLGIESGAAVRVTSRVGVVEVPAEVTDDVMPGVVSLPHGFGHGRDGARMQVARAHAGVSSNRLTDGTPLDPLSGNAVLNGIPVEVVALQEGQETRMGRE